MSKRIFSVIMLTLLLVGVLHTALNVRLVTGWSNGGYSDDPSNPKYGTHDWLAQHALDWLPTEEKQYILDNLAAYLYGTELPDKTQAPDGIGDTAKHQVFYFANGSLQDDASAVRAQQEYDNAVSLFKAGDLANATKRLGIMTHYICDVAVFGHVMDNETHHSDYETYVDERTNNYTDEFNIFLVFDGTLSEISAYNATLMLAYDTTFDFDGDLTCVWMDQNYNWSNPVFKDRCGESLNLAVNYLADVLHTLSAEFRRIYVNPSLVKLWTPAYGTTFTVNVIYANVGELYGFEFKLYWNTTLLDLINVDITPPSSWGTNYFVGMNDTREDLGRYWLALAALNPAPSFRGSTTLAKLTFKSTYDPIYPRNVTSKLDLADTNLSDPEANPIPHDAYDGEYWCYSTKVKLKAEPPTYKAKILGETFTVNVTVADIVNLYSFEFQLSYNTILLDAIAVNIGSFLNPPYRIHASIDDVAGVIWFSVESQALATSTNGSGILATITLQVTQECGIWCKGYVLPECDLHLYGTVLKTKQAVTIPHDMTNPFVHFVYMPIPGDLNSDGIVNVLDVAVVARVFGSGLGDSNWDRRADLNRDGKIDIYDLVLVSKNYGRTEP